jgi:hypothetical protein
MEFLYSDDPFSVFLTIVILVILFIISLNILMGVVNAVSKQNEVYVVRGITPGNIPLYIPVNPAVNGSVPIDRSNNKTGIEFSWSVWLNIADVPTTNTYQHVFSKGEGTQVNGKVFPNNSPGLYITQTDNQCNLVVVMNTFDNSTVSDEVTVPNIPLNKWINVILRVMNNNLDVYINGSLVKSHELSGVPRQNYGDVNVALDSGFNGYLSNLMYFTYGVSPGKITSLSNQGPNLKVSSKINVLQVTPSYLSTKWYSDNIHV